MKRRMRGQALVGTTATIFLILFVVALAVYYGLSLNDAFDKAGNIFQNLPLTDHALQKKLVNAYNLVSVATMAAWMEQGNCRPIIVYTCPDGIMKYICPVDSSKTGQKDLYAGLIAGNKTWDGSEIIITGFVAPLKTWERMARRDGCTSSTMPLDWMMP